MALKWTSLLITVVAVVVFTTANIVTALVGRSVPEAVNLALVAGTALAAIAEFYRRLDARLNQLTNVVISNLDEIVSRLTDLADDEPVITLDACRTPSAGPGMAGRTSVVPLIARTGRGYPRRVPTVDA